MWEWRHQCFDYSFFYQFKFNYVGTLGSALFLIPINFFLHYLRFSLNFTRGVNFSRNVTSIESSPPAYAHVYHKKTHLKEYIGNPKNNR